MEFKIGRLYFRYIQRSKLEDHEFSALKLAGELASMGFVRILPDQTHYVELKKLPSKRDLIESIIDKYNLEAPLQGKITFLGEGLGEIIGNDKRVYSFHTHVVHGPPIRLGDLVTFKTAYTIGQSHIARNIQKQE